MQFPESWLRAFCNPPLSSQELADLLTMSGMEVEATRPVAPLFSGIVVAQIISAEQHPNAERLRVCRVDAGPHTPDGPLQIVCGAPNARAGIRVPLAVVGAELPPQGDAKADGKPFRIGVGKLRGLESFGMLCSARELHIADDHGGLLELAADAPLGASIRDWLKLDDTIFTLKLTPNLAHVLSIFGVAREVSALTGVPLTTPVRLPVVAGHDQRLPVKVLAPDLCGRFSGRIVRSVNTQAQTPAWMVERLARCGQRSVNALVDISNYVMFEYGQPTHIFDLDKIHGELVVRWGRAGETLKLLNGNTVELDEKVGVIADVIADVTGDQEVVESLAGIMGGDATSVSDDTRNVYVEAAFWWPQAVQGRSRRYNFSTDAGHRFERGVDPARTVEVLEHITRLIGDICGGVAGPIDDQTLALPQVAPVTLRVARAAQVIGMPVTQAQCAQVFRRLGLHFSEEQGALTVLPPSWRFDLKIEEDLIEEVIRVNGYDRLPATPPLAPITARAQPENRRSAHAVRRALAARDYQETINYSFVEARWEQELAGNASPIRVLNPIAAPLSVMRSSLIGGLVQVLRHNLSRKATRVRIFELGRVFSRDPAVVAGPLTVAGVSQPLHVAGLAYGAAADLQWGCKEQGVDFFDLKGDVEALLSPRCARFIADTHPALHPGRCARVLIDGRAVGYIGELHPRWRLAYELPQAPVLFEVDLQAVLGNAVPVFEPVSRQQTVLRDVALVLPDAVTHDALLACLRADPAGLIHKATLFDIYKPALPSAEAAEAAAGGGWKPGERSLAVRLELRDDTATLTDARIDAAVQAAICRASQTHGARLRS